LRRAPFLPNVLAMVLLTLLLAFSAGSPANALSPANPVQVTINWTNVHQIIDGFGASSAWKTSITDAQADMFFSVDTGIGLSLLRNRIAPDGTTAELSVMQKAVARGAKVWSAPWTPPASWKDNNDYNNGGHLLSSRYQDYANQLANYVANMKAAGIDLLAISIQNEPNYTASYESCLWTAQEFHDFVPYLYSALVARGVASTKIMVGEESGWEFDLTTDTMNDANTASKVGILAAHNYDRGTPSAVNTYGKQLWETEVSDFDAFTASISDALIWAESIHEFMTGAEANAWHYWWLISGNADNEGLTDRSGNPAKRMYALGNFSKFVRPGYYRIGATSAGGVLVSAYKDPASGKFAIVAINTNSLATPAAFSLTGWTTASVTPWVTSATLSLASQSAVPVAGSTFSYELPASSIVTFAGQSGSGDTVPPVITGVASSSVTSSGAGISWTTNEPSNSQVEYGPTTSYGSSTSLDSSLVTSHSQVLAGLSANTPYHFRVKSRDAAGNISVSGDYTFVTSTLPTSPCDLNNDGTANVVDLQILINVILGGTGSAKGDLNVDSRIDVLDLQILVNVILGLRACQ
jgi:glucuronoarabinoxylan endo-1,4-beta-xylanase